MSVMMAHCFLLAYPDPLGWAAYVSRTCCHAFAAYKGGGFLSGPPPDTPAMSSYVPDESHQRWVSGVKLRMPRHIRNDSPADTPLVQCASWPLPSRWYEAHKEEIRRWKANRPHTIQEVVEMVRRDLTVVHPLFQPARYTTIVEGRPVQAQRYNLILFSELILWAW